MTSRSRGFNAERELVRKLWKMGLAAMRGPASGAKVKKSVYPDVVAIKDRYIFVFEVKARKHLDNIYIPKSQIDKLIEFARRAGGEPLIAVKIHDLKVWKVIPASSLIPVSEKRYKISREMLESAYEITYYIKEKLNKTLISYIKVADFKQV